MRIALRTSGGRGEYEVAGSHGPYSVGDLVDHHIKLQVFPGKELDTGNWLRRLQGKSRIRLADSAIDRHIYLQLADILLMPIPKRELGKTAKGNLQLTDSNYSISSVQFDIVRLTDHDVLIQPTALVLENVSRELARIDVFERLRIVLDVWSTAQTDTSSLSEGVRGHRNAVVEGDCRGIRMSAEQIRGKLELDDPLRQILREYSIANEYTYWAGVHRNDVELLMIDDVVTDPVESAKDRIREWRIQAARGSKGAKFSNDVKAAYGNRCLFSGYYLPKSSICATPGVDSAHILPWADYGINSIGNGICLNKLCHWAFDSGILVLEYVQEECYELTISSAALLAEKTGLIGLDAFRPMVGRIPNSRLPTDSECWPSPRFLDEYNKSFG